MRKIKFRGKSNLDNKWHYGYYFVGKNEGTETIVDDDFNFHLGINENTLGQFTGLFDKNGVEIYEGDILGRHGFWEWYVSYEDGGFRKVPTNSVQKINWEHSLLEQDTLEHWEVIGNIHDNPELLKGDK